MLTFRKLFVVALIPLFSGCSQLTAFRHQGLITQGDRRPMFTSCDGTQRQIVLPRRYQEEAQEEIVSELKKSDVMFGDLYGWSTGWKGSLLEVGWFERLEHSTDGCSNPDPKNLSLRAFGNQPNWNLRLIDKRLRLERPGAPSIDVPYHRNHRDKEQPDISAEANGESLSLWWNYERCVDRITGGVYYYTARLQVGDTVLQGCSYNGEHYDSD